MIYGHGNNVKWRKYEKGEKRKRRNVCVSNWTDLKKLKIVFSSQKVYQNFDWDSVIGVNWISPFLLEVFFEWDWFIGSVWELSFSFAFDFLLRSLQCCLVVKNRSFGVIVKKFEGISSLKIWQFKITQNFGVF